MTSFRGQASWAKMTSRGGNLTALECHPTKKVNKAEEPTLLSTKIASIYTFSKIHATAVFQTIKK
jgi:hypothetical protein